MDMNTDQLLETFRASAIGKQDALDRGDSSQESRYHRDMRKAVDALYGKGTEGRSAFGRLLHDPSPVVATWVAAELLANGDESAVPGHDGIGADDRGHLAEGGQANGLTLGSQSATLIVRQPEPPIPELILQDAVLFLEVGNDLLLVAIEPSGQRDEENLEWV